MKNSPKLIISADDYGLNQSVNDGILMAVNKRTVTSVHVLVNVVTPSDMTRLVNAVKEAGNKCGIGLHLNTTYGKSLIQSDTNFIHLVDGEYEFYDLSEYNHDSTNYKHMRLELNAQIELLAEYLGGVDKIDALSSHHNLHFFDKKFIHLISKLSNKDKIPMRSPVFWRTNAQYPKPTGYPKGLKQLFSDGLKSRSRCKFKSTRKLLLTAVKGKQLMEFRKIALKKGGGAVPNNTVGHWYGQPDLEALDFTIKHLRRLNNIKPNFSTEIYTHPAATVKYDSPNLVYNMERRVKELEVLTNRSFVDYCEALYKRNDFDFGSFRSVL